MKEGRGWPDKYNIEGTKFKLWWTLTSCKQAWTFATNECACTPKMEGLN